MIKNFMEELSRVFDYPSSIIVKNFSELEDDLKAAKIEIEPVKYVDLIFLKSIFFAIISFFAIYISFKIFKFDKTFIIATFSSLIYFMLNFVYFLYFPKLKKFKKTREIEGNLPYVLRHAFIQLSSGVPIYQTLLSIAYGDYGEISEDFKEIINRTEEGVDLNTAISEKAYLTHSKIYKNILWQIADSLKTGADLSKTLKALLDEIIETQKINIKLYRSQINIIATLYLITSLAIPTIAIILVNLLTLLTNIVIPLNFYILIFILLIFVQYTFVVLVDSKRPVIL